LSWGWGWPYYSYGYPWYPGPYPAYEYGEPAISERAPASIETDVSPKAALVRLDGEVVGKAKDYNGAWDVLHVGQGDHMVEFEAPGMMTLRIGLSASPGRYYRFDYDLREGSGIDPRSIVPAPSSEAHQSPPNDRPESYGTAATTVPRRGLLKIVAAPENAAIYLDGEFLASARELSQLHGAIPVVPGEHRIEAVLPGHASKSIAVDVTTGDPVRVEVSVD
jgi:hypothetical protein